MTTGDPNVYPASFPTLSDLVIPTGSNIQVPLEALANRTEYLKSHLGQIAALTFQTSVGTSNSFNVLKYSEALQRWFGCAATPVDYLASTQQLLVWPAVTDVPGPQLTGVAIWDFDVDDAGNLVAVEQLIDNVKRRTAGGVWSRNGTEGESTAEPNVIWEPVTGNWILAFTSTTAQWVRTSTDLFVTWTNRTAPAFPVAARVTLGHNGAGRVVAQAFSGTDTLFSFSDDGGVTWSAPTTHALGFTYATAGARHHPRPVFNGKSWVAVGMNNTTGVCRVFTSPDGVTWSVAASYTSLAICNIAALGGIVIGCALNGANAALSGGIVYSADDGATWRRGEGTFNFSSTAPRGVANTSSRFVLLANQRIFPGEGFMNGGGLVT